MGFKGWILAALFTLTSFSALTASAAEQECVSKAEMEEIASHFSQFRSLAKGEYCLDGSQTANLIAGILFMRKTAFASSMPKSADELFSGEFSTNWYDYFIGRINEFDVQSSCPKGVGAFVYFFGNTMYVCPMLLSENFTAMDRASVFMHEARHIDGFPHTTCRRGARAGLQGACDDHIRDGGSYAVTVETYAQLSRYATDLHPAMKAYARSAAVIYADEAFDQPTRVDRELRFLVMTTDREFHVVKFANGVQTEKLGQSPALGHIVMRGQHMSLFPDDKNLPAKYVFARDEGDLQQQAGDLAMEYNAKTPQQRAELVDLHIAAQWTAQVYTNRVRFSCDPRAESNRELSFNGVTPVALLYPTGYDRAARSTLVATADGAIYELGCTGTTPFLKPSNVKFDRSFKRIYKSGDHILGLGMDGRLFEIQGETSTAVATAMDGRIHELIPNQSYGFFDQLN